MATWLFMDYIEPSGQNPIARWLVSIPEEAAAHINTRLLSMETLERWPEKWTSDYKGAAKIFELRIPFAKVQYRPLVMFSPHVRRQIVLLTGAIEKDDKIPRGDIKAAEDRRDNLVGDASRAERHKF